MSNLDVLFRSIIEFEGPAQPSQRDLVNNFKKLRMSKIEIHDDAYKTILGKVTEHYNLYQEVPSYPLLMDYFANGTGNESAIVALENIREEKPWLGSSYASKIKEARTEQNREKFNQIVAKAMDIVDTGVVLERGKPRVQGVDPARDYLLRSIRDLVLDDSEIRNESQIISERERTYAEQQYDERKKKSTEAVGIYTGLQNIDEVCGGLKHTELMITGGYVGQLKTTTTLNIAYNAIFGGWDGAFVTLEMSFDEIRTMLYVLHTCNPMFFFAEGGRFKDLVGKIDVNKVINGDLTSEEEEFYKFAIRDLSSNEHYGRMTVWQPNGMLTTLSDLDMKFREIDSDYKQIGRKLEFVAVDYLALLGVERETRSRDPIENLTQIIKGAKKLCLNFNNNQGLRMLSPWQMNRQGFVEACQKTDGVYSGPHLANAAEVERSADVIIASFMDEPRRESGIAKYSCLKNRRNPWFKPFEASIAFQSRYITNLMVASKNGTASLEV